MKRYRTRQKDNFADKHKQRRIVDRNVDDRFMQDIVKPCIIKLRGEKCEDCGVGKSARSLDLHHEDYDNPTIHTLKLLCRKCHNKKRNDKKTT